MSAKARAQALEALIEAHATELKLPTVRRRFRALAEEAVREQQPPVAYLAALLEAETQERAERRRRWIDDREQVVLIGDSGTGKTHLAPLHEHGLEGEGLGGGRPAPENGGH